LASDGCGTFAATAAAGSGGFFAHACVDNANAASSPVTMAARPFAEKRMSTDLAPPQRFAVMANILRGSATPTADSWNVMSAVVCSNNWVGSNRIEWECATLRQMGARRRENG
jgi:hypothetical protein